MISLKNALLLLLVFLEKNGELLIQATTLVVRYSQVFVGSNAFVHLKNDQIKGFEDMMMNFTKDVDDNTAVQTDCILTSQGPRRIRRIRPRPPPPTRRRRRPRTPRATTKTRAAPGRRPRTSRARTKTRASPGRSLASKKKPQASSSGSNRKRKETPISDQHKQYISARYLEECPDPDASVSITIYFTITWETGDSNTDLSVSRGLYEDFMLSGSGRTETVNQMQLLGSCVHTARYISGN